MDRLGGRLGGPEAQEGPVALVDQVDLVDPVAETQVAAVEADPEVGSTATQARGQVARTLSPPH